jgi:hypothetical protein
MCIIIAKLRGKGVKKGLPLLSKEGTGGEVIV